MKQYQLHALLVFFFLFFVISCVSLDQFTEDQSTNVNFDASSSRNFGSKNGDVLDPREVSVSQLHFNPREPETWVMENGLKLMFEEDKTLPIVNGVMYIKGGVVFEPEELSGLASAAGRLLRTGGTKSINPDELDKMLDSIGASIESSYSEQYGTIAFSCLSSDLPVVMKILSEIIEAPAFDSSRLELWKKISIEGILRRKDDPDTMASMIMSSVLYGDHSSYNRVATTESINKISTQAVKSFYEKFSRPNGSIFAISGDVTKEDLLSLVNSNFTSWVKKLDPLPSLPMLSRDNKPGLYVLRRKFNQSAVLLGHLGPPRIFPEMYSVTVFNRLFGAGGLESRLYSEIRTKEGLAYSVYGGVYPGSSVDVPNGSFQISIGTRNGEVSKAIGLAVNLTQNSVEHLPELGLVNASKNGIARSFVFKFATPKLFVQRAALMDLLGYADDYDYKYLDNINQVTVDSVLSASEKWVHPDRLSIVVVGDVDAKLLLKDLASTEPSLFGSDKFHLKEVVFEEKPRFIEPST